jgi:ABC-2 type transport system permease protein
MIHTGVDPIAFIPFALAIVVAFVIFWCFAMLLPNILAFYVFDSERLSRYVGTIFLDGVNYPGGLFSGAIRVALLTVLPSLLVGVVPVDILRGIHMEWLGFGVVIAVFWWSLTLWLFKRALRRYESANLVGAR